MRFTLNDAWADAVEQIRGNRSLLVAVAGAFFFLPAVLLGWFIPFERPPESELPRAVIDHLQRHWHWLLLGAIVEMVGTICILSFFLKRDGRTVAAVIAGALALLPFFFAASFLASLLVLLGLCLLIVPGAYLFGRLGPLGAVVVAEDRRNPIDAIKRTLALTVGHGWAILGLLVLVYVAGFVVNIAATSVLGSVFIIVAGRETGLLLALIVGTAITAAVSVLILALLASVYSKLRSPDSAPAAAAE